MNNITFSQALIVAATVLADKANSFGISILNLALQVVNLSKVEEERILSLLYIIQLETHQPIERILSDFPEFGSLPDYLAKSLEALRRGPGWSDTYYIVRIRKSCCPLAENVYLLVTDVYEEAFHQILSETLTFDATNADRICRISSQIARYRTSRRELQNF